MSASEQAAAEDAAREERWRKATRLMEAIPAMADDLRTMLRHDMANFLQVDVSMFYGAPAAPAAAPPLPLAASQIAPQNAQHAAPLHIAAQAIPPVNPIRVAPPPPTPTVQRPSARSPVAPEPPRETAPAPHTHSGHDSSAAVTNSNGGAPVTRAPAVTAPTPKASSSKPKNFVPPPVASPPVAAKNGASISLRTSTQNHEPPSRASQHATIADRSHAQQPAAKGLSVGRLSSSFQGQALEVLQAAFQRNRHPSYDEINQLRRQLGIAGELKTPVDDCPIYRWFCNRRTTYYKHKSGASKKRKRKQATADSDDASSHDGDADDAVEPPNKRRSGNSASPKKGAAQAGHASQPSPRPPTSAGAKSVQKAAPSAAAVPPRPSGAKKMIRPKPLLLRHVVRGPHDTRPWTARELALLERAYDKNSFADADVLKVLRRQLGVVKIAGRDSCAVQRWFHRRRLVDRAAGRGVVEPGASRAKPTAAAKPPARASPAKASAAAADVPLTEENIEVLRVIFEQTPTPDRETIDDLRVQLGMSSRARWSTKHWRVGCPVHNWFHSMRWRKARTDHAGDHVSEGLDLVSGGASDEGARWDGHHFNDAARALLCATFEHSQRPNRQMLSDLRSKFGITGPIPVNLRDCPVSRWFSNHRRPERVPVATSAGVNMSEASDASVEKVTFSDADLALLEEAFQNNPTTGRGNIDAVRLQLGLSSRAAWSDSVWRANCPVYKWFNKRQRIVREKGFKKRPVDDSGEHSSQQHANGSDVDEMEEISFTAHARGL